MRSENYVNVIVSDKQRHLQYLDMEVAIQHCTKGIGIWDWASTDEGVEPDVVLATAGDIPYAYEHGIDKPEIVNWKWPY